jgi:hypothetical protein
MADKWQGDDVYVLPQRQVEPYRLWLEYLKLALSDDEIDVDREFYREWGDVENTTFNQWWSKGAWRHLFAIDNQVRIIGSDTDDVQSEKSSTSLDIRIPLGKPIKNSLEDVRSLLEEHGASIRLDSTPKGKFYLTPDNVDKGFIKHMSKARMNLRLYRYRLIHQGKTNQAQLACQDWYRWATDWNNQIETKGWNREKIFIPTPFHNWCGYLESPDDEQWGEEGSDPQIARRQVLRYMNKARNLARNVGKGVFPGEY